MEDTLAAIARDGNSAAVAERMATFREREVAVDTAAWLELDRRYSDMGGTRRAPQTPGAARGASA
jgi:hypothetical protein